jgi:hypothetical protein
MSGGDTVGVGVDFTTGRAFFTKNGALIGMSSPSMPYHSRTTLIGRTPI